MIFSSSSMRPNSIRNWLVGWVARLPARVQTKLLAAFLSIVGLLIVLGAVARVQRVGVLTDGILAELGPLLRIGLGWIGFIIGFRLDAKALQEPPKGIAANVASKDTGRQTDPVSWPVGVVFGRRSEPL